MYTFLITRRVLQRISRGYVKIKEVKEPLTENFGDEKALGTKTGEKSATKDREK